VLQQKLHLWFFYCLWYRNAAGVLVIIHYSERHYAEYRSKQPEP